MDILTIFNYDWADKHYVLLRMWISQINLYNDLNLRIIILSEHDEPNNIKRLHNEYQFEWVVLKSRSRMNSKLLDHHNVKFKMWNLCRWTNPYIFIDVDAIIFSNISHLVNASQTKPWIGVNHQSIPRHTEGMPPFLNGGLQIVSNPRYFSYNSFTSILDELLCPGAEQALIFSYFKKYGYDYVHPAVTFNWNACAGYTKIHFVNGRWQCYSVSQCIINKSLNSNTILEGDAIHINHYWDEFKPWKIRCPMYRHYLKIVKSEETATEKFLRLTKKVIKIGNSIKRINKFPFLKVKGNNTSQYY